MLWWYLHLLIIQQAPRRDRRLQIDEALHALQLCFPCCCVVTWDIRDSDLHQVSVVMDGWDGWDLEKNVRIIDSNELNGPCSMKINISLQGATPLFSVLWSLMFSGQWGSVLNKGYKCRFSECKGLIFAKIVISVIIYIILYFSIVIVLVYFMKWKEYFSCWSFRLAGGGVL